VYFVRVERLGCGCQRGMRQIEPVSSCAMQIYLLWSAHDSVFNQKEINLLQILSSNAILCIAFDRVSMFGRNMPGAAARDRRYKYARTATYSAWISAAVCSLPQVLDDFDFDIFDTFYLFVQLFLWGVDDKGYCQSYWVSSRINNNFTLSEWDNLTLNVGLSCE
jgi:hypothetical protein